MINQYKIELNLETAITKHLQASGINCINFVNTDLRDREHIAICRANITQTQDHFVTTQSGKRWDIYEIETLISVLTPRQERIDNPATTAKHWDTVAMVRQSLDNLIPDINDMMEYQTLAYSKPESSETSLTDGNDTTDMTYKMITKLS